MAVEKIKADEIKVVKTLVTLPQSSNYYSTVRQDVSLNGYQIIGVVGTNCVHGTIRLLGAYIENTYRLCVWAATYNNSTPFSADSVEVYIAYKKL